METGEEARMVMMHWERTWKIAEGTSARHTYPAHSIAQSLMILLSTTCINKAFQTRKSRLNLPPKIPQLNKLLANLANSVIDGPSLVGH